MKILLIFPKGFNIEYTIPFQLGYLKSNLKEEEDVRLLDCSLNNIDSDSDRLIDFIKEFKPDLVGITCWASTAEQAIDIFRNIKKIDENIITVIGGIYFNTRPILNKNIDYGFRGESEFSFPEFVEELKKTKPDFSNINGLVYRKNGEILRNKVDFEHNLDKIKIPDYDFINLDEYLKRGYRVGSLHKLNAPILATRGCPYKCKFCSASILNGAAVRKHSVDYLVNWVKHLKEKGIKHINIMDDNFTFDVNYAKEFCKRIINLNLELTFGTPNGIRIDRCDKELIILMKRAGWKNLVVAPESGSERMLKRMGKILDLDDVVRKVRMIQENGLKVHGFFMIGYPEETVEDLKKTIKFIRKCRFDFFFIGNFHPLPGTEIYQELVEKGEVSPDFVPTLCFADGGVQYKTKSLMNVNFPFLRMKEYLYFILSNPHRLFYIFRLFNPALVSKRIIVNFLNIFQIKQLKGAMK